MLFTLAGLVLTDIIMSAEYILPHTEIFQAVYSKKRLAFLLQWSFTKKPLKAENWSLSMCSRVCKIWKLRENWLSTYNQNKNIQLILFIQNSEFEYFFDDFERWSGTLQKIKRLQLCKSKMYSIKLYFLVYGVFVITYSETSEISEISMTNSSSNMCHGKAEPSLVFQIRRGG